MNGGNVDELELTKFEKTSDEIISIGNSGFLLGQGKFFDIKFYYNSPDENSRKMEDLLNFMNKMTYSGDVNFEQLLFKIKYNNDKTSSLYLSNQKLDVNIDKPENFFSYNKRNLSRDSIYINDEISFEKNSLQMNTLFLLYKIVYCMKMAIINANVDNIFNEEYKIKIYFEEAFSDESTNEICKRGLHKLFSSHKNEINPISQF